jgi:hypothetical protein
MISEQNFEYYYGSEAEQFTFYRIPKILFVDKRFSNISSDAKILYGLLLDRMSLSLKNGWLDSENRVYIYFTVEEVMEALNIGREKCAKIFSELDTKKGCGLILRKMQGLGKPAIIYVMKFHTGSESMIEANIIQPSYSEGTVYRFKYPYIFYYFAGRYIAYNLKDPNVTGMVEKMSSALYNETYGNIIIFVCHFAGSNEIIDTILLNAYGTFESYEAFDFQKSNPIFDEIKEAVDALIPKVVVSNSNVEVNKQKELLRMDEIGINDGTATDGESVIDTEVSEKEKEMASVTSALKTIEVLGQILQNYPVAIKGEEKLEIITEMHKLGMRSIQAIINTMGYVEKDLIEYIMERATKDKKNFHRDDVAKATRKFINMLVSGMARGMVHQVAISLNSEHLLPAAQKTFEADESISSKLILADLKMNCINKFSYDEIHSLKGIFESSNEMFASRILDSIIGHYLNYNKCDHSLRTRLCSLCGFSEQQAILAQQKNLLK